jgi:sulfur-carrier protein adenylyltransferase/sulfurtransferase
MTTQSDYYREAFSRNIGLLTQSEQSRLCTSRVAIAGLGGAGGLYATTFARLGFGNFHIADLDVFEIVNMNRQQAASVDVLGQPKVNVVKRLINSINPGAKVSVFENGINAENIEDFLKEVDVVLDGVDFFNIEARRLLFSRARAKNIFAITAGPIGFGSSMIIFDPKGMSFDDYFDMNDSLTENEKLVRFGLGLTPTLMQRKYFKPEAVKWKEKKAPSLVTGTLLCANLVSTEALRIVFGEEVRSAPLSVHFDPYLRKYKKVWIPFGNKNPIQRLKRNIMTMLLKSRGSL